MTDPIADMFVRIKNATMVRKDYVDIPHSKMKERICSVLEEEGFIKGYDVVDTKPARTIRVYLKYTQDGSPVISEIKRMSKPGRRIYVGVRDLPYVRRGLGICILSTSKGIMSDKKARKVRAGGELLGIVW